MVTEAMSGLLTVSLPLAQDAVTISPVFRLVDDRLIQEAVITGAVAS